MTTALSLKAYAALNFVLSQAVNPGFTTAPAVAQYNPRLAATEFTNGTGDFQCTDVYSATITLAGGAHQNFDLAGSLTDALNNVASFATIKGLLVVADPGNNAANVVVGGAAANAWFGCFNDATDKAVVQPGGTFFWLAPKGGGVVTPGTGDILLVTNSSGGTTATFTIFIFGN